MKTPKTPEELAKMVEMGVWFKDVRETQSMNISEFAKFIGIKDREVRPIEEGKSEIEPFVLKIIKRRTGREFGEKLPEFVPDAEIMDMTASRPIEQTPPHYPSDRPLVRVRPEALAARKKVLKERAKEVHHPRKEEELKKVSEWLKDGMKLRGFSHSALAAKANIKESTIRSLLYCYANMKSDVRQKIMNVLMIPGPNGEPQAYPKGSVEEIVDPIHEKLPVKDSGPDTLLNSVNAAITEKNPPTFAMIIDKIIKRSDGVMPVIEEAIKNSQITCTPLCNEFQLSKVVGKRQYLIFLKVYPKTKTFRIESWKRGNAFNFSASRDITLGCAVADLIKAAVLKADEEFSLIP